MKLADDGTLRLSPSDLANHLACPHLTQLAAALERGEIPPPPERENAHAELIARKGEEHEAAFLAALQEQGREVVEIGFGDEGLSAAARRTEEVLRAGVEVVYQGVLSSGGWRGIADFLVRIEEPSELGSFSYEAWDTKLARSAKPVAAGRLRGLLPAGASTRLRDATAWVWLKPDPSTGPRPTDERSLLVVAKVVALRRRVEVGSWSLSGACRKGPADQTGRRCAADRGTNSERNTLGRESPT